MAKPFIGHDGEGTEVRVQTGTGTVEEIRFGSKGVVADVYFGVEGMKHPIHGWIPVDEEAYKEAVSAKDDGREVSYRIESQRKEGIDKSTPIAELRKTMEDGKKNTKMVLVGVNGVLTRERLTHPDQDPGTGRGVPAEPSVATPDTAGPASQRSGRPGNPNGEPAPWSAHFFDGRPNLASYAFGAVLSTEATAREHLVAQGIINPMEFGTRDAQARVAWFARVLLSIADAVQVSIPELVSKVDRVSNSHSRARQVTFDTLKYLPFHKEIATGDNKREKIQAWESALLETALLRFQFAVSLLTEEPNPARLPQASAPQQQAAPSAPPADEQNESPEATPTPEEREQRVQADLENLENATSPESASPGIELLPPRTIDPDAPKADDETMEVFREFVNEANVADEALPKVSALLHYTFGVSRVKEVPQQELEEFMDYYIAEVGADNFSAVLEAVSKA